MAQTFNATTTKIEAGASTPPVPTTDLTIGAWVKAGSAGEGNAARIVRYGSGTTFCDFKVKVGLNLQMTQECGVTDCASTTNETLSTGVWTCVVMTYDSADKKGRIYVGTIATTMAQLTYSSQVAGSAAASWSTAAVIGNATGQTVTWDGQIERAFALPWLMRLDEMEAFRLGRLGPLLRGGTPLFYLPLTSPDATKAEDLSGRGTVWTVTSGAVAEGPPVPMNWAA